MDTGAKETRILYRHCEERQNSKKSGFHPRLLRNGMIEGLALAHAIWRFVILISGGVAIGKCLIGWLEKRKWTPTDQRIGVYFVTIVNLGALLGVCRSEVDRTDRHQTNDDGRTTNAKASHHWSLVVRHWSSVVSHWSSVVRHWSLVVGHWSLVVSHAFTPPPAGRPQPRSARRSQRR